MEVVLEQFVENIASGKYMILASCDVLVSVRKQDTRLLQDVEFVSVKSFVVELLELIQSQQLLMSWNLASLVVTISLDLAFVSFGSSMRPSKVLRHKKSHHQECKSAQRYSQHCGVLTEDSKL